MDSTQSVVVRDEQDPFLAIDESLLKLKDLIDVTMTGNHTCSVEEYVSGENSLSTCREMDDENWENAFLEDFCREPVEGTMQDEEDDEDSDEIELAPKINTYNEVNEYLEEVQHFLES